MSGRRVDVQIDRLVLRGFGARQRDAIASGLRAELARQLSQSLDGVDRARSIAALHAGRIHIDANATAHRTGRLAARSVIERLRR